MQESYPSPSAGSHSTDTQQQGCALFVRTLRFRLIALGFLANLLLVGMMLLIMLFSWEHSTRQALQVRSYEVRQLLQAVLQEPLRYEDYPRVVDLVNQSFTQSDLLYLAVENQQGQQIALLQQSQIIPSPSRQQEALASVSLLFSLSEGVYQRSVITDGGKVIGQVSYVLSLQTATAALKTLLLQVLLVMVVSILLLGLLTALIGLWIGRPLSALIRAARAIADGDYQASLPPSNANEIGRLAAAFAQMRDALREQMSTLRQQRETLHAIADYTYAWEMWLNREGKLYWLNPSVERITGYRAEELLNEKVRLLDDIIHPEDSEQVRDYISQAIRQQSAGQGFQFRMRHRDGRIIWVIANWQPLYSQERRFLGLRASLLDYTSQKQADLALQQAIAELQAVQQENELHLRQAQREQARLRALFSSLQVGVVFVDHEDRIVYANPAFAQLWGLPPAPVLNQYPLPSLLPQLFAQPHVDDVVREFEVDAGVILTAFNVPVSGEENGRLWVFQDVTDERAYAEQLRVLAERDTLTGIFNRRRFQHDIEHYLYQAQQQQHSLAILLFDLNRFKQVNDTYGHAAGDQVLVEIARTLGYILRTGEWLYRLGGDEFAILLPDADLEAAAVVAQRVQDHIAQLPFMFEGQTCHVGSSIGVAVFPQHASDTMMLTAVADAAMYEAKKRGGQWCVFDAQQMSIPCSDSEPNSLKDASSSIVD